MKKIVGAFEKVSFPEFGIQAITAKVDTGAYSGALHCTKIHEEVLSDGRVVLHFSPFDHPENVKTVKKFYTNTVRSSNGSLQMRYFIYTNIVIGGDSYRIRLSLANRSEMKWPVLIGRRFLHRNNILVDVTKG